MDPFIHFPEQRVVVCSKCKHAVLPSNINTHLRDEDRHNMSPEDRKGVIQEVEKVAGLIQEKMELNRLSFPPPNHPPIPVLQEPRGDGLKCQLQGGQGRPCHYIACQLQKIQQHCREKHGVTLAKITV
jgi:hypothetical protein